MFKLLGVVFAWRKQYEGTFGDTALFCLCPCATVYFFHLPLKSNNFKWKNKGLL